MPTGSLTNVPAWAAEELSSVLAAGLAYGDANEAMSAEALSTLLRRAYAAKGTNLKDDYYAAVNKSWLDGSDIPAGLLIAETDKDVAVGDDVTVQVKDIGLWQSGGTFDAGDPLASDDTGCAVKAAAGKFILGFALEASTAAGQPVSVQITKSGYAAAQA